MINDPARAIDYTCKPSVVVERARPHDQIQMQQARRRIDRQSARVSSRGRVKGKGGRQGEDTGEESTLLEDGTLTLHEGAEERQPPLRE